MNCVDYVGVSPDLPIDIKYFKEELFDSTIHTNPNGKEINKIISVSVNCNTNSIKLVNTKSSTSNEGQTLTGKKLLIELTLNYRIKYTTNTLEKYIYVLKSSMTKIMYIVVPPKINEVKIDELIRRKRVSIEPYIEDIYACCRDDHTAYVRTLLLLNANIKK